MQVGDTVNYHSIIGGPVTSAGHKIEAIENAPNNYGCDVAWVSGKSGCVAMRALSFPKLSLEQECAAMAACEDG